MLDSRVQLNRGIQNSLDAETAVWGIKVANAEIKVANAEIKQVDLNENMIRAIDPSGRSQA